MQHIKAESMPTWLSRTLLIGLGAILVLMPLHAFISTWGGTAIGPLWLWKSWKELLLVLLAVLTLGWLGLRPAALRSLARDPLAVVITVYLVLSSVLAWVFWKSNGTDASLAGLAMNLRYLGVAALAYLLFRYGVMSPRAIKHAGWFVVCAGVTVAVIGILQVLILPSDALSWFGYNKQTTIAPVSVIDDNPDLVRAFATLRGPNDFGAFLILPILLVMAYMKRLPAWVSITMFGFLAWALILSGSRSAWIGALLAVGAYGFYLAGKKLSPKLLLSITAGAVLILGVVGYASTTIPVLRQAIFHSSPGDSSLTEGSTDKHLDATLGGIDRVAEQPLGCGVGCAGPASYYGDGAQISENYFVQIAEEVGLLGLWLFLLIIGLVAYRLYAGAKLQVISRPLLAALVGYLAIGMLLHVWSDDPLSITWWMLAGAVIGYNESNTWIKSKNSSRSKTSSSS